MSRYRYNSGGVILDLKRDMSYHAGDIVDLLEGKDIHIAELQKQLKEKENEIQTKNTINNLYKATLSLRDNDFKDLVYENNLLKQQLKSQPAEIVEKIKEQLIKRLNTIAGYGRMTTDELSFLIEAEFGSDLDTILKEYQEHEGL